MKKIYKTMIVMSVTLIFVLSIFSVNYAEGVVEGIVIDKYAVLCGKPESSSQSIGTLTSGEKVYIDKNQGKWYQVSTKDGRFGWIHSEAVLVAKEDILIEEGIIDEEMVEIREKPDEDSEIQGHLGFLSKITVVGRDGDWCHLAMGDETIGWVRSENVFVKPIYPKVRIVEEVGSVKEEASHNSEVIKELKKNTIVKVDDFKDGFMHIVWEENKEGFIYADEVRSVHKDFIPHDVQYRKSKENKKEEEIEEKETETEVGRFDDIIQTAKYLGDGYYATAYDLSIASCGKPIGAKYRGMTRAGVNLNGKSWDEAMVIAVDPRRIPLGSKVLIIFDESDWRSKYNGVYTAADTGGGVKGKSIDIYLGDNGNKQMKVVRDFGRSYKVKVYLLD